MRNRARDAALCLALIVWAIATQADPSPRPSLNRAVAALDRGDWAAAFDAGKHAFRDADNRAHRYHAARVAAIAALSLDRPVATRFWLRRASDHASGPVERARVARNYRILQDRTPWRFDLDLGVRRSDNVNNGASSPLNVIDDFPLVGVLSGRAQALPGTIATTRAQVSRRLHRTDRAQTRLSARLIDNRVRLDDDAQAIAPGVRSREFDQTELGLTLSHSRAWDRPGHMSFGSLGVARSWYARDGYARSVEARLGHRLRFGPRLSADLRAGVKRRDFDAGSTGETLQLGASLGYRLSGGGAVHLAFDMEDTTGEVDALDRDTRTALITYRLGQPVFGIGATASLGVSRVRYDAYRLGFFPIPGGRTDDSVFGTLDLTLDRVSYAGFRPRVTIRAADTQSNVSRFATDEVSISLSLSSAF